MEFLACIFVIFIGTILGSCGGFLMAVCRFIKSKAVQMLVAAGAFAIIFVPAMVTPSHEKLLFWCTIIGMFVFLFAMTLCSANSEREDFEEEVLLNNVE